MNEFFKCIGSKLLRLFSKFHNINYNSYKPKLKKSSFFDYDFMMNLDEKDYPKYLKQAYYIKMGQKLNLRNPKTLNEKIQWLKIYDNIPLKTTLTDKVLVRDWVKEEIGEEYLKPFLQICSCFDEINFDKLPERFIVKCNHGCKWHFVVRNKQKYLETKPAFSLSKYQITNWLSKTYFGCSDFELQYKNIKPQIIIEPMLVEQNLEIPKTQYQIFCFNGKPKIFQIYNNIEHNVSSFNENFNNIDLNYSYNYNLIYSDCCENLKQVVKLSEILAKNFKFVRIDWLEYNNKVFFEEMTFTPSSGFIVFFKDHEFWQIKLGKMLSLKGD